MHVFCVKLVLDGAHSLSPLDWSGYDETLRMICAFDMDPPVDRRAALYHAMERANDKCWT
ncbi:MAG: YbjN domain-containing protein, partial [Pseudomonadota bacterium]